MSAWDEGYAAYGTGEGWIDNPYEVGTDEFDQWDEGWTVAELDELSEYEEEYDDCECEDCRPDLYDESEWPGGYGGTD